MNLKAKPSSIWYPVVFGVLPALVFGVLYKLELLSGFIPTVYGITYSAFYIPFSVWIINKHFPFRIKSITPNLFWTPYLIFSSMHLIAIISMALFALIQFFTGTLPHYMLSGVVVLPAIIINVVLIIFIIRKSRTVKGEEQ